MVKTEKGKNFCYAFLPSVWTKLFGCTVFTTLHAHLMKYTSHLPAVFPDTLCFTTLSHPQGTDFWHSVIAFLPDWAEAIGSCSGRLHSLLLFITICFPSSPTVSDPRATSSSLKKTEVQVISSFKINLILLIQFQPVTEKELQGLWERLESVWISHAMRVSSYFSTPSCPPTGVKKGLKSLHNEKLKQFARKNFFLLIIE